MFVRVGVFHGAPEHLDDDAIRHARQQMLLRLQQQPGFAGQHILADRQTGKTLAFSFWETEAALRIWEKIRGPIVADHEATTGRTEQEGGSYVVVFSSEARLMPTPPLAGTAQGRWCPEPHA